MAGDKADLPDLPHPGGVHHHHKAFFDRHTYQHDAHPVRISNARSGSDSPPLRSPSPSPSQRSHARTLASTGSRNRRGSGSSPGGVPILAQVGVQPGRRALGRSSHAQTRRSLTRACRALALVALSRSLARSFARIIRFFSPTLRGQIQYHSRAHRKNRHAKIVRQDNVLIAPEPPSFWNGMSDLSNISWHVAVWFCLGSICWIVNGQYACVLEL